MAQLQHYICQVAERQDKNTTLLQIELRYIPSSSICDDTSWIRVNIGLKDLLFIWVLLVPVVLLLSNYIGVFECIFFLSIWESLLEYGLLMQ